MTLLDAVLQAHHESALRGNCSHHAVVLSAMGSGDYFKAIAAGLMTLGGIHGPLTQTYDLLSHPDPQLAVIERLGRGERIPGWGNGFVKGEPDPIWELCADVLREEYPDISGTMTTITWTLHERGKMIYPNPSCFTAAAALALGIPRAGIGELFIRGRLSAWTQEYTRVIAGAPVIA